MLKKGAAKGLDSLIMRAVKVQIPMPPGAVVPAQAPSAPARSKAPVAGVATNNKK